MILHQLIARHLTHGDDDEFYRIQAADALRWISRNGVPFGPGASVLDLGCGHGIFGERFLSKRCRVTFSDSHPSLRDHLHGCDFYTLDIGNEPMAKLGRFDLVLFSNVYEHLPNPEAFIREIPSVLNPGGVMFFSWTNWLSPWGGHDFSPLHYLGPRVGPRIYDWIRPGRRQHFPFAGLWPTHIGRTIELIKANPELKIVAMAPRYYTELDWITRIPVLREFLTWNCAILITTNP